MNQGGAQGIREVPGRDKVNLSCCVDDRRGGWRSGHCKTVARDGFRVVYAVQLGEDIWVVHAFQKKSTQGIKTPARDIDLIKNRLKSVKGILG